MDDPDIYFKLKELQENIQEVRAQTSHIPELLHRVERVEGRLFNGLTVDVAVLRQQFTDIMTQSEQSRDKQMVELMDKYLPELTRVRKSQDQGNSINRIFGAIGMTMGIFSMIFTVLVSLGIIHI